MDIIQSSRTWSNLLTNYTLGCPNLEMKKNSFVVVGKSYMIETEASLDFPFPQYKSLYYVVLTKRVLHGYLASTFLGCLAPALSSHIWELSRSLYYLKEEPESHYRSWSARYFTYVPDSATRERTYAQALVIRNTSLDSELGACNPINRSYMQPILG